MELKTTEKISVDGKDYNFRILGALEYDTILDTADNERQAKRKLISASTGIPLSDLEDNQKFDRPTYARLSLEFDRLHSPKGLEEIFSRFMPSPKPSAKLTSA